MDKITIINEALSLPRIAVRVKKLKINQEQLEDALPILIDIIEEQKMEQEPKYITSFNVSSLGKIVPTKILSATGQKKNIVSRIITQDISPINIDLRTIDIDKTQGRVPLGLYLKKYKKNHKKNPKGFYLYGDIGIGKTYISQAMANTLAEKGQTVAFLNIVDLVSIIKSKFSSGYTDFISKLKEVDHLFLDDIGAEIIVSWFRDEILLNILSSRMNRNKSTFFTSNFSYEELLKIESRTSNSKFPDKIKATRLLERIKTLSHPIKITGKNRRY